jgi:hypothetical protein
MGVRQPVQEQIEGNFGFTHGSRIISVVTSLVQTDDHEKANHRASRDRDGSAAGRRHPRR